MAEYTPEQLASMKNQMEQLEALSRRQRLNESEAQQLRELQRKLGADIARSKRELVADSEKQLAIEKELLSVADNAAERIAGRIDVAEAEYDLQRNKLQLLQTELEALYEADDINEELIAKKTAELQFQRDITAETKKTAQAVSNVEKATERVIGSTLGISDAWEDTVWGSIISAEDGLSQFGDTLKSTFGDVDKMMGSLTMAVVEQSVSFALMEDDVLAGFNKATMAGGSYNTMIQDLADSNRQIGASMQDVADTTQTLHLEMSRFSLMSTGAKQEMADFAIGMEVAGVAGGTTAAFLDNAMLTFGKTGAEAMEMQESILGFADALGVAGEDMMAAFIQATPRLAEFGAEGEKVFKELAAQAKATGVEVNSLIGIAQSFDTYESAAQSVGQLNAIMGGPLLNTTEMLLATDSERIDMLAQSMEAGELQWNQMNRFQKKAVANAAGITDMAQAEAMFSRGAAGLREHQAAVEAEALAQEEQNRMQRENVTMMNQVMLTMQELAVAIRPLIEFFGALARGASAVENSTGLVTVAVRTSIGAWMAYKAILIATGTTKASVKGLTWALTAAEIKQNAVARFGWLLRLKDNVTTGISNSIKAVSIGLSAGYTGVKAGENIVENAGWVAKTASTAAEWAGIAARKVKNVLVGISTLLTGAEGAAIGGLTLAKGGLITATWGVVTATWASTVAFLASPIGWVVAGVALLVAALVGLVMWFGNVEAAWDAMVTGMKAVAKVMAAVILSPFNLLIAMANTAVAAADKVMPGDQSGWKLDYLALPKFAAGTDDFAEGGAAVVGERGAEMVVLPPHSAVINNQNTEKMANATQNRAAAPVAAAAAGQGAAPAGPQAPAGPTTVILQMSDREVGRVVIDAIRRSQVLNVQT